MKKVFFLMSFLVLIGITNNVKAQQTEEFKPSGKLFGLLFADYRNTFSDGHNVSTFEVTRSFFGYDYSFSKTITGRILFDAISQDSAGKSIMTGYLRNAYLQYDNGKFTLCGGLIGSEQISMTDKFWNYRYISKPSIDYSGMTFPADLGIMVKYKPADAVAVDLSLVNGRGFKDITPDTTLRLTSGITVTPAKNILFRAYYDMMGPSGRMQWTASFTGAFISQTFTLGAEYLLQNNHLMADGENYSGFSIFTAFRIKDKYSLFGRFDKIGSVTPDGEAEPWNLSKDGSTFILGIDYSPAKNVRISPNFTGFIPDDEDLYFTGIAGINIEARF